MSTDIVVVLVPPSSVMVRTYPRTHICEVVGRSTITKKDWKSTLALTLTVGADGGPVTTYNTNDWSD